MLVSRSGLSPIMVGRDGDLAQLVRCFDSLSSGEAPAVAIVSGEAGVGKTRLLRELATAVGPAPVLGGQAEPGDLTRPFELLRDALESEVSGWREFPEALVDREHTVRHVLAPLVSHPGEAHGQAHGEAHDGGHEHTLDELLLAATEVVRHVVADRRTLVLFEDLHWADAESVALFLRLATTPDLPVLLVGSFRPEDFDRRHPLAAALPALERQRTVAHVTLGRLGASSLTGILEAVFGQPAPSRAVTALHDRTQGNPFFLEELIATGGYSDPAELADAPLPWNVAEAILSRVDELSLDERRVLDAAALLSSRISFDLLAAVTGVAEDELIGVLHTLVDRGLLVEQHSDEFSFRHALTREAVASQLFAREQRRIHEAALATLRAAGSDDLAALARHADGAGRAEELVAYAAAGAARARREGSGSQALRLAELGLSRCEVVSATAELELRSVAATAAFGLGMLDVARRHAEGWRILAVEEKDRAQESAALRQLARLRRIQGDPEGHRELLVQALAVAEGLGESEELAWCLAYQAQLHMLDGEPAEAIVLADRALAMADAVGCPQVRPDALVNKGTALTDSPGGGDEGLALLDQAAREALEQRDVATALRAYNNAVVHLMHRATGGRERAWSLVRDAYDLVDRYGVMLLSAKFASSAIDLAAAEGNFALAQEYLARGLREVSEPEERLILAASEARIALELGRPDEAEEILGRSMARGGRLTETDGSMSIALATLALRVRQRDDAAVAELLAQLRDEAAKGRTGWMSAMANEAVLTAPLGPLELLTELIEEVGGGIQPANATAKESKEGGRAQARAVLSERRGEWADAAASYREAIEQGTVRPAATVSAAHQGLARCLAELGERDEARRQAQLAVNALGRWPSGWRREEAEAMLRRLGGADPSGSSSLLTPREVEVVALLVEGFSNREVAERLYIATKTAAVHVSNILAKTGLGSRTEVATWALRSGLVPATEPAAARR